MSVFPTAAEARLCSRNNLMILDEIRAIEFAIYAAIDEKVFSVRVKDSPMTDPLSTVATSYYKVLFENVTNRALKDQIDQVKKNFTDLGYTVTPLLNVNSGNTFLWEILW